MTTTSKLSINLKLNSFIETVINEFSGIPGIKLELISPTYFKLIDSKSITKNPDSNVETINKACGVIKIMRRDCTGEAPFWEFLYASRISGDYDPFYSIIEESHVRDQDYTENTLLINFLKAYYKLSHLIDESNTETYNYFSPSISYINLGVMLGILLCGERRLETDCHFHFEEGKIVFKTALVANSVLIELDDLKKENARLTKALEDIAYHRDHFFEESKTPQENEPVTTHELKAFKKDEFGSLSSKPTHLTLSKIDMKVFGELLADCIKEDEKENTSEA